MPEIQSPGFLTPDQAAGIGIREYGIVATDQIPFSDEVRRLCEGNACRCYGTSWACPPAVGTLAECRARCRSYARMLVFNAWYPLEDSFDFEHMHAGLLDFKSICDRLFDLVCTAVPDFLLLSNESCFRCARCTYPDAPCRHPDRLFPSLEGYGILVQQLASAAGIPYIHGANTVSFFGGLLFDRLPSTSP